MPGAFYSATSSWSWWKVDIRDVQLNEILLK